MARQDWILIGKNIGRNQNITEYMNKKNNNFITIIDYYRHYDVIIREGNEELDRDEIIKERGFKRKSQALKYARRYMRTH